MSDSPSLSNLWDNLAPQRAVVTGWLAEHWPFLAVIVIYGGAGYLCWHLYTHRKARGRGQRSSFAAKVGPLAGWKEGLPPKALTWPRDPQQPGAEVIIRTPKDFPALASKTAPAAELVAGFLGGDWAPAHRHRSHQLRYVRLAPVPVLPAHADYPDRPEAQGHLVPLAVTAEGTTVYANLARKTPHVLVSATTGWGKSSLLRLFAAHVAGHGGLVDVIDPKRGDSMPEFEGLENVRSWTEPEDFARVIHDYREEVDARYKIKKQTRVRELNAHAYPRRLLVLEEMGTLVEMLSSEWEEQGKKGRPAASRDIMRILWQGRAANMHVITAAQQANAEVLIKSDARDQYALKIAAGPQSVSSWTMMFGAAHHLGDPTKEPELGHAFVGVGPRITPVLLYEMDPGVARELAARGQARFPERVEVEVDGKVESVSAPAPLPTRTLVQYPEVEMHCKHCGNHWTTKAQTTSPCPQCKKSHRIPVGKRR